MFRNYVLLLSLLFLAACGGGGGGGDAGTGGNNPQLSMVPTPPVPGAVLYANAADLRPLRAGAQWQYHGTVRPDGGAISTYYTASLRQAAGPGQGVAESSSDVLLSGNDTVSVTLDAGIVHQQVTDPLGLGSKEVVSITELRSPVRTNDQYTQIERNDVSLGADIDGDGKIDVADVAIYATVIGTESVSMPELGRTISAVRVDTTALLRTKHSSDGSVQPVQRTVQSIWYAAGVGVIRRTQTALSSNGVGPVEYDETLFSWDGVTEGLGAVGPMAARVPQQPNLLLLPTVRAAAVVGDKAIALADSLNPSDPMATSVAIFDKHGTLQNVIAQPGLLASPLSSDTRIFGLDASSALVLTSTPDGVGGLDERWQRLGVDGSLLGVPVTVPLGSAGVIGAWDGQAVWLAWIQPVAPFGGELRLRPFGLDGQPLAPVQVLDSQTVLQLGRLRIAAAAGQALVAWTRFDQGQATFKYATLSGGINASAVSHTLATNPSPTPIYDTQSTIVPLIGSGVSALIWTGPVISYTGGGPLPETQPRGITLDSGGNPLRSTGGTLDNELLPAGWSQSGQPFIGAAQGGQLVFASFAASRQIPQLNAPSDFVLTNAVTPGASALASATAVIGLADISGSLTNIDQFGRPVQLLLWDDRALVFGDDGNRTMVSLFWLR